jgi:pilus assembly protein CpaD
MFYNRTFTMLKTQKAHSFRTPFDRGKAYAFVGVTLLFTTGCGNGYAGRAAQDAENPVLQAHLNRTVLEAHVPTAVAVEARLVLAASSGAQGLTGEEYSQLTNFANDFVRLGRGSLVISVPANAGNSQTAALVAQDAQRALYAGGVDYAKISGGTYQADGRPNAPVMLSFARYEAQRMACQPWSEVDPRKTASNLSPDRFGCAQNANLAAMVADPGDLLGDRTDPKRDAGQIQVGVDKLRKGEVSTVSGAVAGGGK